MQIWILDRTLYYQTIMKSTRITGFKGQTFYNFRKANSVTIVLQLMTSRNSFATKHGPK